MDGYSKYLHILICSTHKPQYHKISSRGGIKCIMVDGVRFEGGNLRNIVEFVLIKELDSRNNFDSMNDYSYSK